MATESRKRRIGSRCATCFERLSHPYRFPEDFPDEWKMCCDCKGLAGVIVRHSLEDVVRFFIEHTSGLERKSHIKRTKRIKELITLA